MRKNRLFINGHFVKYESLRPEIIDKIELDQQSDHVLFIENLTGKQHAVMFKLSRPSLNTFAPVIIPEGQYFMMGDNRDNSADSRFFGFVERKLIVGRATLVVISREGSFFASSVESFF